MGQCRIGPHCQSAQERLPANFSKSAPLLLAPPPLCYTLASGHSLTNRTFNLTVDQRLTDATAPIRRPSDGKSLAAGSADEAALVTIAATLTQYGVPYLRTSAGLASIHPSPPPLEPRILIQQLAQHSEPRVYEAFIPLFPRHPEFHPFVQELAAHLDAESSLRLRHLYTAAVYLQNLWRTNLGLYLGQCPNLPNYFGETDFGLPPPHVHWGEAGLRALAARMEQETGANWLSSYESACSRFMAQLQLQSDSGP